MRRVIAGLVLGIATVGGVALAAAPADAGVCLDINININGTPLVYAECHELPPVPPAPTLPA